MTPESNQKLNIAVIGGGISGITTAYLLQRKHHVTLFEKNDYVGGHTNTITIGQGADAGTPVDTGFIVLNKKTYPNFLRFLDQLDVSISPTDMSFGYHCRETGLSYASSDLNTLFAQRKNILSPSYWRFMVGMMRFIRSARSDYHAGRLENITLGDYLQRNGYGKDVIRRFVIPMAAAIWSASDIDMMAFPMRSFAQFYNNHGLLAVSGHPPWFTVSGGSCTYVKKFLEQFSGTVLPNCPVHSVRSDHEKAVVRTAGGDDQIFDRVVIAAHADEALAMLADPTTDEKRLLSPWRYSRNRTVLHTDESLMPPVKRAWASWNYIRESYSKDDAPVTVTYHMNRLQRLRTARQYFVSLNPGRPIQKSAIIAEFGYTHPTYSFDAFASQRELPALNSHGKRYFCGSYFGYGFHEDGVVSAVAVAKHFGITL